MNKRESAGSLDFSFSGLKAAVARRVELGEVDLGSETDRADMAASFQHVAFQHLDKKVGKAIERARAMGVDAKTLVVSGGVASNQVIRARLDKLCEENGLTLACPPPRLCTDNGVMIAWAGIERFRKGYIDPYTIDFRQRWPLEELKSMGYPRDV
ncbi:Mitochondrial tRNAs modification protein [Spiromyces aspiralis]|uniref:Mitochondrial tRNAs modification protein n=1 Tax=Spiromyces aspiralis TaxID=68401 RepID=A0ACC1HE87_9FUNG|nr:Mitochondrial tRNAs modification protein [Spiromyces aspiralis]